MIPSILCYGPTSLEFLGLTTPQILNPDLRLIRFQARLTPLSCIALQCLLLQRICLYFIGVPCMDGDLGGNVHETALRTLRWGTSHASVPTNISRSTVIGREAKFELTKKGSQGGFFCIFLFRNRGF